MIVRAKWLRVCAVAAACVVSALAAHESAAADLGGRPRQPPPDYGAPPLLQVQRWAGFYVGGTAGYSFGDGQTGGDIGSFSFDQEGFNGTLLAGYNWQFGSTVLGVEGDIGTGNLESSTATGFGTLNSTMNVFGSVRARAGFLVSPALLLYATGGGVWADMDFGLPGGSGSETFFGYQYGGGGELAVSSRLSLRAEYLYTDLESERISHAGLSNTFDPDYHTVRAGLAYKF